LIGKIYLTVIRLDITFDVGVLSRYMHQPRETHWLAAIKILAYIKSYLRKEFVYKKYGYVYAFLDTLIQVMLVTEEIKSLLLGIAPLLEKIW